MATLIDLPTTSELVRYDPAGTLLQSSGGSASADGDPVGEHQDNSASVLHMAQATGSAKPTFRASVAKFNGRPGVEYGGDDYLSVNTSNLFGGLSAYTFYIVYFTLQTTVASLIVEASSTITGPLVYPRANSTIAGAANMLQRGDVGTGNTTSASGNIGANDGNRHLLVGVRHGTSSFEAFLDGVSVGTNTVDNPGTTTCDRLALGALFRVGVTSNLLTGTLGIVTAYSVDNVATTFNGKTITQIITDYYTGATHLVGGKLTHPLGRRLAA